MDPCAISCGNPMPKRTWDGSRDPDAHAEPVDTYTPFIPRLISMDSPSMNWKLKSALLGSLLVLWPLSLEYGISLRTRSIRWSLSAIIFSFLESRSEQDSSAATPMPTMPGTLVVPALRPSSCSPPCMNGGSLIPFLTKRNPMPLGPPNLCPLTLIMSMFISFTSMGMCPNAWTASV